MEGLKSDQLFGQLVVQKQLASWNQVKECLRIQARQRELGRQPRALGQIMVEKGYLTPTDVEKLLLHQRGGSSQQPIAGYELLAKIGVGGMGTVYRAKQLSLERTVAIKILPSRLAKNEQFVRQFITEARTVASLNHENIIAGIDVGESNGYYFFAMEYVDGRTVADIIKTQGPIAEEYALDIGHQMAKALRHANKHGLVHRDVKPHNIMLTKQGVAKLCDLGLARQTIKTGKKKGKTVGTPHYMSPEQARGHEDVDIRSDIYSLGASLYHMLTGMTLFEGDKPLVLMTKHLTESIVPPVKRNPDVRISRAASLLVMGMLQRRPEDRYQTPDALIEQIERVQEGRLPKAKRKFSTPTPGKKARTRLDPKFGTRSGDELPTIGQSSHSESDMSGERSSFPTPAGSVDTVLGPKEHRILEGDRAGSDDRRRRRPPPIRRSGGDGMRAFIIVFLFCLVGGGGLLFLYKQNQQGQGATVELTEAERQAARESLDEATRLLAGGDRSGAIQMYEEIRKRYKGTEFANQARSHLRDLGVED